MQYSKLNVCVLCNRRYAAALLSFNNNILAYYLQISAKTKTLGNRQGLKYRNILVLA